MLGGNHTIKINTNIIHGVFQCWQRNCHTYRACNCCGFSKYIISWSRDIYSPRCSIVTHRYDYIDVFFFGSKELISHHFAGNNRSTWTVDPEYNGFSIFIFMRRSDLFYNSVGACNTLSYFPLHDRSLSSDNCNMIVTF